MTKKNLRILTVVCVLALILVLSFAIPKIFPSIRDRKPITEHNIVISLHDKEGGEIYSYGSFVRDEPNAFNGLASARIRDMDMYSGKVLHEFELKVTRKESDPNKVETEPPG